MEIVEYELEKLYGLERTLEKLDAERVEKIESLIPAEIRSDISDLNEEYGGVLDNIRKNIAAIREKIITLTLEKGETVKTQNMYAVYRNGRKSWDSKRLERLAKKYPDIANCCEIGAPIVAIQAAPGRGGARGKE